MANQQPLTSTQITSAHASHNMNMFLLNKDHCFVDHLSGDLIQRTRLLRFSALPDEPKLCFDNHIFILMNVFSKT